MSARPSYRRRAMSRSITFRGRRRGRAYAAGGHDGLSDAGGLHGFGQAAAQFPGHAQHVLVGRLRRDADGRAVDRDRFHADDGWRFEEGTLELRVGGERGGRLLKPLDGVLYAGEPDRHIDDGYGVALALVADPVDFSVADVPDHAVRVTNGDRTQPHALDDAGDLSDVDHVADAVLVLQQHEQAGDEVLHQRLRAEAE